jgi:serine/threonine protein phosphatase PrpC
MQFYSVCDGHGYYGHDVSGMVKKRLPELLVKEPGLLTEPARALRSATLKCDAELNHGPIDVRFSGTTMVSVLLSGKVLYCANSGDSRAVLARQVNQRTTGKPRQWLAVALSRDHKPDEEDEAARIISRGGRIEAYTDENGDPLGPARVWLQEHQLPGLAMSRSLGDSVAASVGVTAEPEILECSLTPEDRFIVIGSDGVFEFLSSEDVVRIVAPYWKVQDVQGASERLVQEAELRWTEEEDVVDDITALVLFLDVPGN